MSKEAVSMCKAVRTMIHHCQHLIIPFDFIYIGVIMRVPHWNREGLLVITAFISLNVCLLTCYTWVYRVILVFLWCANLQVHVYLCIIQAPDVILYMLIFRSKYIFFAILNFKNFNFERILKELLMKQLELFLLTTFIPWNLWKVLQQHFTVATFYPEFYDESDLQFF